MLWGDLDRRVGQRHPQPQSLKQLAQMLQAEWSNIPQQTFRNLKALMGRLCQAVSDARGGHTRY